MIATKYPKTRDEANQLLAALAQKAIDMPLHLIRYCLLMTGDLA